MEISSNINIGSVNGTATPKRPKAARVSDGDGDQDQVMLNNSTAVQKALDNTPASRPDVVARARQLISDPSYPGPDVTRQVSQLLANKILQDNN